MLEDNLTTYLGKVRCPHCDIRYMDFRRAGRLGCPQCYSVFREGVLPLLERAQHAVRHRGKRPRRSGPSTDAASCRELRLQLRTAIEREDYEAAADLQRRLAALSPHEA